jgi:ABC-type nitrate/sulfonate/bicarbonate transport system permease component
MIKKLIAGIVGFIFVIGIWYLLIYSGIINKILLPYPHKVLIEFFSLLKESQFWIDLGSTTFTWLGGIVLGVLFGSVLGLLIGINQFIYDAFEPWIEFIRSLPSVVLVPLVALFFGVGINSRLACSAIVVTVMLLSNIGISFRSIKLSHIKLAQSWKITKKQKLIYFILPAALSHLVATLKSAIPIALIVAVAADMLIATDNGIGKIIMDSMAVLNTTKMYAAIFVVGILGYTASLFSNKIEQKTIHWSGK